MSLMEITGKYFLVVQRPLYAPRTEEHPQDAMSSAPGAPRYANLILMAGNVRNMVPASVVKKLGPKTE